MKMDAGMILYNLSMCCAKRSGFKTKKSQYL